MFGAVNALFSGLAMMGAIYAVILQNESLRLQHEELKQLGTPMVTLKRGSSTAVYCNYILTNEGAALAAIDGEVEEPKEGYSVKISQDSQPRTWLCYLCRELSRVPDHGGSWPPVRVKLHLTNAMGARTTQSFTLRTSDLNLVPVK